MAIDWSFEDELDRVEALARTLSAAPADEAAIARPRAPDADWTHMDTRAHAKLLSSLFYGVPRGIRTPVTAVRGRCPGPLDEGDEARGPYLAARHGAIKPHPLIGSIAEVDVLQRLLELERAQALDRGLQVVALLAGDAQLVALNRRLHFELAVLDLAHEALAELLVDALLQEDRLPQAVARGLLGRLELESAGVDLAPRQVDFEELVHLLQLQLVIGKEDERPVLARDGAFAALEVEARGDLSREARESVVDFGEVEAGDDIEAWHRQNSFKKVRAERR